MFPVSFFGRYHEASGEISFDGFGFRWFAPVLATSIERIPDHATLRCDGAGSAALMSSERHENAWTPGVASVWLLYDQHAACRREPLSK